MLDTQPVLVIAFTLISGGTTPGTRHTLNCASRRGIPVVIVTPDGQMTERNAIRWLAPWRSLVLRQACGRQSGSP